MPTSHCDRELAYISELIISISVLLQAVVLRAIEIHYTRRKLLAFSLGVILAMFHKDYR